MMPFPLEPGGCPLTLESVVSTEQSPCSGEVVKPLFQPFIDGKVVQWDNNTVEVLAVHQWALLYRTQLRKHLRLNVSDEHPPVRTVNKLLRRLGYQVKQLCWKGSREDRERQYSIENFQDVDRNEALKTLEDQFTKRLQGGAIAA